MKEKKKLQKMIVYGFLMTLILLLEWGGKAEAYNGTVYELSNFRVSDKTPSLGERITLSFDVKSEYELVKAEFNTVQGRQYNGVEDGLYSITKKEGTTDIYHVEHSVEVMYYGIYTIEGVTLTDTNGNFGYIFNTQYAPEGYENNDYLAKPNGDFDMSEATATVQGAPAAENDPPSVDFSTLTVNKNKIYTNDRATISVKITDPSGIAEVTPTLQLGESSEQLNNGFIYNEQTGMYECTPEINGPGNYGIVSIRVCDRWGNWTEYYNSKASGVPEWIEDTQKLDLSAADYVVESSNPDDATGPDVMTDTLGVEYENIALHQANTIRIKVEDESGVKKVTATLMHGKGDYDGAMFHEVNFIYNVQNGYYEYTVQPEYYGEWGIRTITAIDQLGNQTVIAGNGQSTMDPAEQKDLSASFFNVGIFDNSTGTYITGNGMDNDVTFGVDGLDKYGDFFDKMHAAGKKVYLFWELKVGGQYGTDVKVRFPIGNLPDGTKVKIKHLLASGNIQIEETTVIEGYIWITVDEFSPFMVESIEDVEEEPDVVPVEKVILDQQSITLQEGQKQQLIASIVPDDASDRQIVWTSRDCDVATVDETGMVYAKKQGTTEIIAKAGEKEAVCTVTVKAQEHKITNLELTKKTLRIRKGDTEKIEVLVTPADATGKYTFVSSDEAVATVTADGIVTAVGEGKTTVLVSTESVSVSCEIEVYQTGVVKIGNTTYYYMNNGVPVKDKIQRIGNHYYYFDKTGAMQKNKLVRVGKFYYYCTNNGIIARNHLQRIGRNYYFAASNGIILQNRMQRVGRYYYYFAGNGQMVRNRLIRVGRYYYYCASNGVIVQNRLTRIGRNYYYFDVYGRMRTGWVRIGRNYYYFNNRGVFIKKQ